MVRVLLIGDVRGKVPAVAAQIEKLGGSAKFDVAFCVGAFSADDMDFAEPAVPTYAVDCGPAAADLIDEAPQGQEICPNLYFLGSHGIVQVMGLTVAYLSGRYSTAVYKAKGPQVEAPTPFAKEHYRPTATEELEKAVKERLDEGERLDLLVACDWPAGGCEAVPEGAADAQSPALRDLVKALKPRYTVFGLGGAFFKRGPFAIGGAACRLIGLAPVGQGKWAHGLQIEPDGKDPGDLEAPPASWVEKEKPPEPKPEDMSREEQRSMMRKFGAVPQVEHAQAEKQAAADKTRREQQEMRQKAKQEKRDRERMEKRASGQFAERLQKMLKKTPGVYD